jgi:hypothetical protein
MLGRNSPLGLGNRYGVIRYPFSTAIPITGLGPILDSLVGRRRMDDPSVLLIKKKLLIGSKEEREKIVHDY